MGAHRSAEEVEREHLGVLGPELGPTYHVLYEEVTWLHAKWNQYRQLYATPQTVDLLNRTAGFFFRVIQDVLWEDVVLHIARLTDSPKSMGKANLTLRRLPEVITIPELAAEVENLVDKVQKESAFARDWRNRRIAHRDLSLALDVEAEPLQAVSRAQVERVLSAIRAVLNKIHGHFWRDQAVAFDHFLAHDDAEALTYYLGVAAKAEDATQERLRQGRPLPEDLEPKGEV
jgi:hypothetical protein